MLPEHGSGLHAIRSFSHPVTLLPLLGLGRGGRPSDELPKASVVCRQQNDSGSVLIRALRSIPLQHDTEIPEAQASSATRTRASAQGPGKPQLRLRWEVLSQASKSKGAGGSRKEGHKYQAGQSFPTKQRGAWPGDIFQIGLWGQSVWADMSFTACLSLGKPPRHVHVLSPVPSGKLDAGRPCIPWMEKKATGSLSSAGFDGL